jgi:hypothetical protein
MCLIGLWVLFFALFMGLIRHKYWSTFYSMKTCREYVLGHFLDGASDGERVNIFGFNRRIWQHIREDVKTWTLRTWESWEDTEPVRRGGREGGGWGGAESDVQRATYQRAANEGVGAKRGRGGAESNVPACNVSARGERTRGS